MADRGPLGSGKSTFVGTPQVALAGRVPSEVLPMDGFHFDDIVLNARGHKSRTGVPYTFDVVGLAAIPDRLAADDGRGVAVPIFDRSRFRAPVLGS